MTNNKKKQQGTKGRKAGGEKKDRNFHAVPSRTVHVQPSLVQKVMSPLTAMAAMAPRPRAVANDAFVTVQATHNLMNQRTRKEKSDVLIINNICGETSEGLENAVQAGASLTGRVINVLWNVPSAYANSTTTFYDTRGTLQKIRNFGFTVKNTYSHAIWVHANTPVGTSAALQTVYSRFCGFSVKGGRSENVMLMPGATAKYNIPASALNAGQAFMEFVESGATAGMALGRTLNLASLLVEVPTTYADPTTGTADPAVAERKGGQLCSVMPYVVYDYTELETEFKDVGEGSVVKKQPFTLTMTTEIMDLYGVTHTNVSESKLVLEETFLKNRITLEHTDEGHLIMSFAEGEQKRLAMAQSGLEASVPSLGVIRGGVMECQFKSHLGHIYLWDDIRDEPLVVTRMPKLPSSMAGTIISVHPSLLAPGVYSINWGTFIENAAAAAWEIVKSFL